MTLHSVRRPDGFCLNELTHAIMKELSIFPVMVQMSEPPSPSAEYNGWI